MTVLIARPVIALPVIGVALLSPLLLFHEGMAELVMRRNIRVVVIVSMLSGELLLVLGVI